MHARSAFSALDDPREAAAAAATSACAGEAEAPALVLAFVSPPHAGAAGAIAATLREATGASRVAGCVGGGVISGSEEHEGRGPAIALLAVFGDEGDGLSVTTLVHPGAGRGGADGPTAERAAARAVREALSGPTDRALHVLLPCPFRFDAAALVAALDAGGSFLPTVGGAAAPAPGEQRCVAFADDTVVAGGAVSVLLQGRFRALVACAQGCRPLVPPGRVTRSDGNVILEIDGRPAVEKLAEAVGRAEKLDGVRAVFAALGLDGLSAPTEAGDFLIRHVAGVDREAGVVAVAAPVTTGTPVTFAALDPASARADMAARVEEIAAPFAGGAAAPSFGLLFECLGRGRGLFGEPNADSEAIAARLPGLPIAGFFGNAEIAPLLGRSYVHAYTGVLAVVAPRSPR